MYIGIGTLLVIIIILLLSSCCSSRTMASPTVQSVGRLRPTGRCARMTRGRPALAASSTNDRSPGRGGPKCPRETSPRAPDIGARGTARSPSAAGSPSSSIAFVLGGAIGTNDARRRGHRQRRRRASPTPRSADADFPDKADEQVLVQARDGNAHRRRRRVQGRRRRRRRASSRSAQARHDVQSPLAAGNEGQISEDGRSALVTFSIPGDERAHRRAASTPSLARHRGGAEARTPTCASSSSATRPPTRRSAPRSTTTSSARSSSASRSRCSS